MKNNLFWIGFGTFEELLQAQLISKVVYLSTCVETIPGTSRKPLVRMRFYVIASRLDGASGQCNYWRLPTLDLTDWRNLDSERRIAHAQQITADAAELLAVHAKRSGFRVTKALVAAAKNMFLMDGTTGLIRFDKPSDTFVPVEAAVLKEVA